MRRAPSDLAVMNIEANASSHREFKPERPMRFQIDTSTALSPARVCTLVRGPVPSAVRPQGGRVDIDLQVGLRVNNLRGDFRINAIPLDAGAHGEHS